MQQHTKPCPTCESPMHVTQRYNGTLNMLTFMPSGHKVSISKNVCVLARHGPATLLPIRGIIYLGRFHFTALLISPGKKVWYHDGQTTGQNLELKGDLDEFSEQKLYEYNGMKAVTVMYAKK